MNQMAANYYQVDYAYNETPETFAVKAFTSFSSPLGNSQLLGHYLYSQAIVQYSLFSRILKIGIGRHLCLSLWGFKLW